jgi:hypothetical protein
MDHRITTATIRLRDLCTEVLTRPAERERIDCWDLSACDAPAHHATRRRPGVPAVRRRPPRPRSRAPRRAIRTRRPR